MPTNPTAAQLIYGLGRRMHECFQMIPSLPGTQTLFVSPSLNQYFPRDITQLNAWVYCLNGDLTNALQERRAMSWLAATSTLYLYPPGFPGTISGGNYEFHLRYPREDILEAINDGVGQLGLSWYREVKDETLLSAQQQWRYVAPATQNWTEINKIEIQINTDATATAGGYPFAPADYLNPRVERDVTSLGVETWAIQFGLQPPPGRIIRLRGEAYYPDLVLDSDYLAMAPEWTRPAMSYLYNRGAFNLNDWASQQTPTGETAKVRQQALDELERQKNDLLATAPVHKPGRIITPGRGDGYAVSSPEDWRYLGAFRSAAFVRGGS